MTGIANIYNFEHVTHKDSVCMFWIILKIHFNANSFVTGISNLSNFNLNSLSFVAGFLPINFLILRADVPLNSSVV